LKKSILALKSTVMRIIALACIGAVLWVCIGDTQERAGKLLVRWRQKSCINEIYTSANMFK